MKKIVCITSLNRDYYNKCGRASIETFRQFWPRDIELVVYNEDMRKTPKMKYVSWMNWSVLGKDYEDFVARTENSRVIQFAKKAFPIIHAFKNIECDRLIWIDADVASTAPMHPKFLDMISPDDVLSSHFGVKHEWPCEDDPKRMSFSCETGFFIVNKKHPMFTKMAERYKEYYLTDQGYNLRRFYDGEVYGAVVAEMEKEGAKLLELNDDYGYKSPIHRSIMAPYIHHYKAGLKDNQTNESILESIKVQEENTDND